MPYLRFSRDKRGYENTYVLHTFRREGRSKPRLLYWFRTPPGVRVGRYPLDEEAIRTIEECNPMLSFDWSNMLKVSAKTQAEARVKGAPKVRTKKRRSTSKEQQVEARREAPILEETSEVDVTPPSDIDQPVAELVAEAQESGVASAEALGEDTRPDQSEPWEHPVVTLMGEEMLARLRARYAEIKVRIAEKNADTPELDEVRERAEALNPDRWASVEDAVRGIERFDTEADALRNTLGRRAPRTRKT